MFLTDHAQIRNMFEVSFHGRARDFRWEMHEPVSDGTINCAHLTLTYASTMKQNSGKRVMRSGCSQFQLQGEKIASYREWDYGSQKSMASRTSKVRLARRLGIVRCVVKPVTMLSSL